MSTCSPAPQRKSLKWPRPDTKTLRFGLDDINPKTGRTNRIDLVAEVNDLLGVLELLQDNGVMLDGLFDRDAIEAKKSRVLTWMDHSAATGTLQR